MRCDHEAVRGYRAWLATAVAVLVVAAAQPARADQECISDADCPAGLACTEQPSSCAPCADDGSECPPCVPGVERVCYPKPCVVDADCGGDLVCVTVTSEVCSGGGDVACPAGSTCPEPEPSPDPQCSTEQWSFCAPRYVAACTADADCGDHFTCVQGEVCSCTDNDPSGGGEPTDPECTCEPLDERYCRPDEIACTEDAQCPAGWACEAQNVTVPCRRDEATGETICEDPVPSPSFCFPPYWEVGGDLMDAVAGEAEGQMSIAHTGDDLAGRGGGCRVASGAPFGLLPALVAALLLVRRRRR